MNPAIIVAVCVFAVVFTTLCVTAVLVVIRRLNYAIFSIEELSEQVDLIRHVVGVELEEGYENRAEDEESIHDALSRIESRVIQVSSQVHGLRKKRRRVNKGRAASVSCSTRFELILEPEGRPPK